MRFDAECEHDANKYWVDASALLRPSWHRKDVFEGVLAEMWEMPHTEAACVALPEETIEQKFKRLADAWTLETGHLSSIDDRNAHQAYRQIVDMGWEVVPYLIADLQLKHRYWFSALAEITGICPYDRGAAGNVRKMTFAWVDWWNKREQLMA